MAFFIFLAKYLLNLKKCIKISKNTSTLCGNKIKTLKYKEMRTFWLYGDDQPETIHSFSKMYNYNLFWNINLFLYTIYVLHCLITSPTNKSTWLVLCKISWTSTFQST